MLEPLFVRPDLAATRRRAMLALLAGALIAALRTSVTTIGPRILTTALCPPSDGPTLGNQVWLMAWVGGGALIVWAGGLFLIGAPIWRVAHRRYIRGPGGGLILGGVVPFVFLMSLFVLKAVVTLGGTGSSSEVDGVWLEVNGHDTLAGWSQFIEISAAIAAAGAITGIVVWRVAYRKRES